MKFATLKSWSERNWKAIFAVIIAIGTALAFAARAIFLTDGETLNAIKKKVEADAKKQRDAARQEEGNLQNEIKNARALRADLDRNRDRAERRRAEAHNAVDDCDGDPDCIDRAVRDFASADRDE